MFKVEHICIFRIIVQRNLLQRVLATKLLEIFNFPKSTKNVWVVNA